MDIFTQYTPVTKEKKKCLYSQYWIAYARFVQRKQQSTNFLTLKIVSVHTVQYGVIYLLCVHVPVHAFIRKLWVFNDNSSAIIRIYHQMLAYLFNFMFHILSTQEKAPPTIPTILANADVQSICLFIFVWFLSYKHETIIMTGTNKDMTYKFDVSSAL